MLSAAVLTTLMALLLAHCALAQSCNVANYSKIDCGFDGST